MLNISKENQEFLGAIGGDRKKIVSSLPTSASRMIPGEVLIFRYYLGIGPGSREQRVALVVRCRRGNGVFTVDSGKLVSCFRLSGNSESVVDAIIENLYKKRREASYYGLIKDSLIALLGINSYRTYKLNQMVSVHSLQLRNSDGFKSRR